MLLYRFLIFVYLAMDALRTTMDVRSCIPTIIKAKKIDKLHRSAIKQRLFGKLKGMV